MSLNAEGYFDCLESYMNTNFYGVPQGFDEITLKEKIYTQDGDTTHKIKLEYSGKLFAIKLDKPKSNGQFEPLFHFLDNTGKPWSKRCDFVLFNYYNRQIRVFLFEFKHQTISGDGISGQLEASRNWCTALVHMIKDYTDYAGTLHLSKYVLTSHPNPERYLDETGKYLNSNNSIRHYLYSDINGMHLKDLENSRVERIK